MVVKEQPARPTLPATLISSTKRRRDESIPNCNVAPNNYPSDRYGIRRRILVPPRRLPPVVIELAEQMPQQARIVVAAACINEVGEEFVWVVTHDVVADATKYLTGAPKSAGSRVPRAMADTVRWGLDCTNHGILLCRIYQFPSVVRCN